MVVGASVPGDDAGPTVASASSYSALFALRLATALSRAGIASQTKGYGCPDEAGSIAVDAFVYGSILDGS